MLNDEVSRLFSPASAWTPEWVVQSAWWEHAPFAFWLVEAARPRTIVELGTHHGFSYLVFCQAVQQLGLATRCFAVDTWTGDDNIGPYSDAVLATLKAHHDPRYAGFSRLIQSTFDDALPLIEDGSVDLLHIDGQHGYDDVRRDFDTWRCKLSDRGVVLFHDTRVGLPGFGVWKFWAEVAVTYPSFEFEHGNGLGVLAVGADADDAIRDLVTASEASACVVRQFYARLGLAVAAQANQLDTNPAMAAQFRKAAAHDRAAQAMARRRNRDNA
jgi:hypothetical protein